MSPTQRSLKLLRERGYTVEVVERWNPYVKIRQDLFGFADLFAFNGDESLLIQTTSNSNVSARVKKIEANEHAKAWIASPHRKLWIHGWSKRGERGKRKVWTCREILFGEPVASE